MAVMENTEVLVEKCSSAALPTTFLTWGGLRLNLTSALRGQVINPLTPNGH